MDDYDRALDAIERQERIASALERIADALERVTVVPLAQTPEPEPVAACQHLPSMRVDFSTMGTDEWHCAPARGGCGHWYRGAVVDDMVLGQIQG